MAPRVLLTSPIPDAAVRLLSKKDKVDRVDHPLSEKTLAALIRPYDAILSTLADPITALVLKAAPRLRCVANYAVGFNNIDLKTAQASRIWVTNTPDVLTEATADLTWSLLLSCARRVPEGEALVRKGEFKGWHPRMLLGVDLLGKTLGIYGLGRIGKAVAQRGKGWGMKVLYHQRKRETSRVERELNARYVPFQELVRRSDILTLHTPLTPETRHRFGRREFKAMKPTAIFLNASRGPLHDERGLIEALEKGWIFSAGLDVYEFEPRIEKRLLRLPNCTLLPHLGSATIETRDRMAVLAAENILLALAGKRPQTPVFEL